MELIDCQLLLYLLKFFFLLEVISVQSTITSFIFLLIPLVSIIIPVFVVVIVFVTVISIIIIPRSILPLTVLLFYLSNKFLH